MPAPLPSSFFYRHRSKPKVLTEDDKSFLSSIKEDLTNISNTSDPNSEDTTQKLIQVIEKLTNWIDTQKWFSPQIKELIDELTIIQLWQPNCCTNSIPLSNKQRELHTQYVNLHQSSLHLMALNQCTMRFNGTFTGACYGYTLSMIDSHSSPYKNSSLKTVLFTKSIHNYQKNQGSREKDQADIKRTRLTTRQFCPSLKKQAQELYKIAIKHIGEELNVCLFNKEQGHSIYLSVQNNDHKIRYMDSNHGVFLFENEEQFISAYQVIYRAQSELLNAPSFKFYQVSTAQEDKEHKLKESISLRGKWRSFLTGRKYSGKLIQLDPIFLPNILIGGVAGAVLGSIIFPLIGTLLGTFLGGLFGATFGGIFGGIVGAGIGKLLTILAFKAKKSGLLGTYHYLRENIYNLENFLKAKLGIKRECDEVPKIVLPTTNQSSYADMLKQGLTTEQQNSQTITSCASDNFLCQGSAQDTTNNMTQENTNTILEVAMPVYSI